MLQNGQMNTSPTSSQDIECVDVCDDRGIDPMTLVMLNFGLFRSLYSMGASREKICSVMLINTDEFEYIVGLMSSQKFKRALG